MMIYLLRYFSALTTSRSAIEGLGCKIQCGYDSSVTFWVVAHLPERD